MTGILYNGTCQPCGRFASTLEARWHARFLSWGWRPIYIGDRCNYADFDVDGIKIEVKPDGDRFVEQALSRAPAGTLIVEGSPGWCRWWMVERQPIKTATLLRACCPLRINGRNESLREFVERAAFPSG